MMRGVISEVLAKPVKPSVKRVVRAGISIGILIATVVVEIIHVPRDEINSRVPRDQEEHD
jgi:hypothetical protein